MKLNWSVYKMNDKRREGKKQKKREKKTYYENVQTVEVPVRNEK